ncbi:hypothetical protein TNCT_484481 [Trichonephila clavata]|uniref:TIL domain-containing protein n=1 Tax=Trichonephila clavata TaxID=2740835 RepID=A0A8X6KKD0_TRICU|nr:hypothetical protein TNCT_484481 [Trichonephila clavata]
MGNFKFLLVSSLLVLSLLQLSRGHTCGQNEHFVDCVNPFNTCIQKGVPCAPLCFPGCDCLPDHFRNKSGACVRKELC